MKTIYKITCISSLLLASCGGGSDDEGTEPDPITTPKATTLVFPENNTECNEGAIISDTRSSVEFSWSAAADTDSYEINIKNLATGNSSSKTVTTTSDAITIDRGTPYEWFIVSKANGTTETATSATWKFYNQGVGTENYAPFPADVISPNRGATIATTTTVSLKWSGEDVDDDIVDYEILFGTNNTPTTSIGVTTETTLDATVTANTVYYWKVITKDSQDNTSSSEVFEFKVE
ncbi:MULTISPECIES: hypothetical protein [unclassified Cellulophaga]|uniref:hypothetical protein n=1 Tax=unclassified Cellulophaga TaxID=2634405 RepID=UPI0026E3DC99|nr:MULTISPECIES: hypothetical protein [unclassified Cellulophaga]MDO6491966.1 hypothetical protein [Cellulophaga sp. 2_MG-2023]MDO6495379.1 hypothetical protein [Cellulophaga sp. 3_MG-2023]